jgi:N-hydroxyarylamine O-acetyltransferase
MTSLDAYFARVGYDGPRTPTLETLRALHRLHPAAIPFEAIDVLLGRPIDLAPEAVEDKLIARRRGGYCFEHNSLFRRMLEALGFEVEALLARVVWKAPPDSPPGPRTHMALKVTIEGEAWLADVGFGSRIFTEPLRLADERPQATRHERFRLTPSALGRQLEVELETGWAPAYVVGGERQVDMDFVAASWFTSTHPTSPFRSRLIVARTTPEARYGLAGSRLAVRSINGETRYEDLDAEGLERVLSQVFGLAVAPEWRPILVQAAASDGV